jgi:hypothetical protein
MWNSIFWPCMTATRCVDKSVDDVSFLAGVITGMQQLLPGLPLKPQVRQVMRGISDNFRVGLPHTPTPLPLTALHTSQTTPAHCHSGKTHQPRHPCNYKPLPSLMWSESASPYAVILQLTPLAATPLLYQVALSSYSNGGKGVCSP